jgi:hypothetical protein
VVRRRAARHLHPLVYLLRVLSPPASWVEPRGAAADRLRGAAISGH